MLQELTNYRKQLEKTLHWLKRQQHCVRKPSKKKPKYVVDNAISHAIQALFAGMAAAKAIRQRTQSKPNFKFIVPLTAKGLDALGGTINEQIIMRGGGAVIVEPRAMKGTNVVIRTGHTCNDGDVYAPNCRFNFDKCNVGAELKHPDSLRHSIAMNIKTPNG